MFLYRPPGGIIREMTLPALTGASDGHWAQQEAAGSDPVTQSAGSAGRADPDVVSAKSAAGKQNEGSV